MLLIAIILSTLAAGIGSVWVAALLMRAGLGSREGGVGQQHLLSLAAGALLATAFMHLLPEAFESAAGAHDLFAVFLGGVVFFFLLDKVELYHHGHEHAHGHDGHHHHGDGGSALQQTTPQGATTRPKDTKPTMGGGWSVLAGDSVHAFGDGILIASAFMADWKLGLVTSLAVLAHEVPHHMGDLVVLRHAVGNQRAAVVKVSLAGTVTALGGLVGFTLVRELDEYLPFFLVVASSSFVYVALADLIPQLQKRLNLRDTVAQLAWLLAGVALVTTVSGLAH